MTQCLEPTMKLETIEEYERKYNLQLPKNFRNYLLNVSSETFGAYRYKVTLDEPDMYFINTITGFDTLKGFDDSNVDISDCDNYTDDDIKKLHELGYYENYFIKTHVNGCTDDTFLCVKGPHYGNTGSWKNGADYFSIN